MGSSYYWLGSLVTDKRRAAVPLFEQMNSRSLYGGLHMHITQKPPNFSAGSCRATSSLEPVQQSSERQQLKQQTTAPSTDGLASLSLIPLPSVQNALLITWPTMGEFCCDVSLVTCNATGGVGVILLLDSLPFNHTTQENAERSRFEYCNTNTFCIYCIILLIKEHPTFF